jgi:DNA-binding protein Fis
MPRKHCAQNINSAAEQHLANFFAALNGVSPGKNLYDDVIAEVEKPLLEHTLRYVGGNQLRASSVLGINRNTLRKKLNRFNIDPTQFKENG